LGEPETTASQGLVGSVADDPLPALGSGTVPETEEDNPENEVNSAPTAVTGALRLSTFVF
jgi:hypothetical protein